MKLLKFSNLSALLLLCTLISCKKDFTTEPNEGYKALNDTPDNIIPRASIPTLFFSCESDNMANGYLQTINIGSDVTNYNFKSFNNPRPNFHVFNKSAGELWGIIFQNGKDKLIKYNVNTKQTFITDIFSATNYVREIVSIDEANKKLFYLEGTSGNFGFGRVMKSNFDGTSLTTVFTSTGNDIVAVKIGNNKLYYASKAYNALVEVPLGSQAIKIVIKNFNLATANRLIAPIPDKQYPYNTYPVNFKALHAYKPIDERRLNGFDIDFTTNEVFWLRNGKSILKSVFGPYSDVTTAFHPDFFKANLSGSGMTNLGNTAWIIEKIGGLQGDPNVGDPKLLLESNIQIDPNSKKIYVAMELIVETNINSGPVYTPPMAPTTVRFRRLKIFQADYNFGAKKAFISQKGNIMVNPFNWNANKIVHPGLYYSEQFFTEDQSNPVFKGSLDSFIFGSLDGNN